MKFAQAVEALKKIGFDQEGNFFRWRHRLPSDAAYRLSVLIRNGFEFSLETINGSPDDDFYEFTITPARCVFLGEILKAVLAPVQVGKFKFTIPVHDEENEIIFPEFVRITMNNFIKHQHFDVMLKEPTLVDMVLDEIKGNKTPLKDYFHEIIHRHIDENFIY